MSNPVPAAGYGRYADGTMLVLREAGEGSRVHSVGIYTSPVLRPRRVRAAGASGSFFGRVGNPELVAVLGECFALARDVERSGFNEAGFEAITVRCRSLLDTYAWFAEPEATAVGEQVRRLGKTAGQILDEFAAVTAARKVAYDAVQHGRRRRRRVPGRRRHRAARHRGVHRPADRRAASCSGASAPWPSSPTSTPRRSSRPARRRHRPPRRAGRAHPRVPDPGRRPGPAGRRDRGGRGRRRAGRHRRRGRRRGTGASTRSASGSSCSPTSSAASRRPTRPPRPVSWPRSPTCSPGATRRRPPCAGRVEALRTAESGAEFAAAMAVLTQRAAAAAASAGDPAAVDAALAGLEAECETLDARFGDVAEFAATVADKRDEIYTALTTRRDVLASARAAKVDRLVGTAQRALAAVADRAARSADLDAFDTFFATDSLVAKVDRTADELRELGEAGRADELAVALADARATARRVVVDHAALFDADGSVRIGSHRFGVNTTPFDLHLAPMSFDGTDGDGGLGAAAHRHRSGRPAAGRRGRGHRAGGDAGPPVRDADHAAGRVPRVRAARGRQGRRRRPGRGAGPARRRLRARHPRRRRRPAARGDGGGVALTGPVDRRHGPSRRRRLAAGAATAPSATTSTGDSSAVRALGPADGPRARPPPSRGRARPRHRRRGRPAKASRAVDGAEAAGYLVDHGDRLAVSVEADTLASGVTPGPRRPASTSTGASLGDLAAFVGDVVPPSADGDVPLPAARLAEAALAVRHAAGSGAPRSRPTCG